MTSARAQGVWRLVAPILICALTLAVYANSLHGEFVFDDLHSIVESPHVRRLWPLPYAMSGEPGSTVSGRPIPALTFALNFAAGGLDVFGYHLVNVLVHALAALALLGLVRVTLERSTSETLSSAARPLAFVAALLWALHPLHTDALNHVSYRTETMMALFYLSTLYFAARAFGSSSPRGWFAAAIACCYLAMGSKEAAVSLPLVVLLYDRQFFAGSIPASLRRKGIHAGLASSWLLLVLLVASGDRGTTVGFEGTHVIGNVTHQFSTDLVGFGQQYRVHFLDQVSGRYRFPVRFAILGVVEDVHDGRANAPDIALGDLPALLHATLVIFLQSGVYQVDAAIEAIEQSLHAV